MNDTLFVVGMAIGFCLVAALGHLSYTRRWAWWVFNGILWLFILGCLGLAGLLGLFFGIGLFTPGIFNQVDPRSLDALACMAGAMTLTGLLGILLMIPSTRGLVFRWFPGNPNSPLHRMAILACVLVIAANGSLLLMLTPERILEMVRNNKDFIPSMLLMQGVLLLTTFVGVGLGITKNWQQTVARLGLVRLTPRGIGLCVAGSLVLFAVITLTNSFILQHFFPETNQYGEEMARMLKLRLDLPIALLVFFCLSLVIGTREELFFRGLLQPAVGTWLSSALFAVIHVQYGLSPLMLVIFAMGVFFSAVRQRYGVTACILMHALYDFYHFAQVQALT